MERYIIHLWTIRTVANVNKGPNFTIWRQLEKGCRHSLMPDPTISFFSFIYISWICFFVCALTHITVSWALFLTPLFLTALSFLGRKQNHDASVPWWMEGGFLADFLCSARQLISLRLDSPRTTHWKERGAHSYCGLYFIVCIKHC